MNLFRLANSTAGSLNAYHNHLRQNSFHDTSSQAFTADMLESLIYSSLPLEGVMDRLFEAIYFAINGEPVFLQEMFQTFASSRSDKILLRKMFTLCSDINLKSEYSLDEWVKITNMLQTSYPLATNIWSSHLMIW
jgi:hypothetical protein